MPAGGCWRRSSAASLWAVQTPQVVPAPTSCAGRSPGRDLERAYDDAQLVEAAGGDVRIVEAPRHNFKVTTPHDLRIAELLLAERGDAGSARLLTDYHTHLRPDDTEATAERYFTERNVRPLPRGGRRARRLRPRVLRARAPLPRRRSTSGAIRSGRRTPSTTWTPTSSSCCG